ncbi:MAG: preprotein translocase subunit SecG [Alphaproteobacteria bacterium]
MTTVLLVIHLLIALAMVGTVLLQRSEGGALGIGGGGGGGGLMSGRTSANLLTRITAVLAAMFMLSSMGLTLLATGSRQPRSILEDAPAPVEQPAEPAGPSVPVGE